MMSFFKFSHDDDDLVYGCQPSALAALVGLCMMLILNNRLIGAVLGMLLFAIGIPCLRAAAKRAAAKGPNDAGPIAYDAIHVGSTAELLAARVNLEKRARKIAFRSSSCLANLGPLESLMLRRDAIDAELLARDSKAPVARAR